MTSVLLSLLLTFRSCVRSRAALQLEVLALRHQLQILERSRRRRLRLSQADRLLWVWLSRMWNDWRAALVVVKPETVIAWHRQGFRRFWTWKSRRRVDRPTVRPDVRTLIRTMSTANPLWGAPRIHGELLNSGLTCVRPQSRNTWSAVGSRRHRRGARSWRITWNRSSPRISSWSPQRPAASCLSW